MSISIKEHTPSELLNPYISFYRESTFNTLAKSIFSLKVIPHGCIDLIIHLDDRHCNLAFYNSWQYSPDFTLIGLYTKPYEVRFKDQVNVYNIRFKPEGINELFGIPASEFGNNSANTGDLLGKSYQYFFEAVREAKSFEDRINHTEQYLKKQLYNNTCNLRNYVQLASQIIREHNFNISIDDLSDKVCISARQLEREFKKKIGVTPKMYMRISRINQVHSILSQNKYLNFADLSYQLGYSDQAHFVRDFKTFTGDPPTIFLNEKERFLE